MTDRELVEQFAWHGSKEAMCELVRRHGPMIYAAALRETGDAHLAQDISQAVSLVLMRRASSLSAKDSLAGWLFQATRYAAADARKARARRARHEQEVAPMNRDEAPAEAAEAKEMRAVLHEAIGRLPGMDREVVVRRYLEGRAFSEIAAALGVSEESTRMRLPRAMERLRKILGRRGHLLAAGVLVGVLETMAARQAPASVMEQIQAVVQGASPSPAVQVLSQGITHMIHTVELKMRVLMGAAAAAAILAVCVPLAWSQLAPAPASVPTAAAASGPAASGGAIPGSGTAASTAPAVDKGAVVAAKGKGLHFAAGPADAEKVIRGNRSTSRLGDAATLEVGPALASWWMSPTDIAAGKGVETAQFNFPQAPELRYHYIILNSGRGVAAADVLEPEGGPARMAVLFMPSDADGIAKALVTLPELPEVKEGSFEVRYLNLGSVVGTGQSFVLWLKADDGGKDYIFAMGGPAGRGSSVPWDGNKLYPTADFFKMLQPLAQQEMQSSVGNNRGGNNGRSRRGGGKSGPG